MRLILTTIIPALLINVSFLTGSKVAIAGSADGKAVYCECTQDKKCDFDGIEEIVFGVFFENGKADMKYPKFRGGCGKKVCLGGLKQDRHHDEKYYQDLDKEIRWSSERFFGKEYSLNRETLLLTINSTITEKKYTNYKRCEVMRPAKVQERIESFISDYNDKLQAEQKKARKNNKI